MNVVSVIRSTTRWVKWQRRLFRKFCGVDVFFVNNGPNYNAMQRDLDYLGVTSHKMDESDEFNPSLSHSAALTWIGRRFLRDSPEPLVVLDMDIFPMMPTDIAAPLCGVHAAGQMVCSDQYYHLWPGLLFIGADAPDRAHIGLRTVVMSETVRLDSGGELWFWIQNRNPTIRYLTERPLAAEDLPDSLRSRYDKRHLFEVKANDFFHIRGITNWFGLPTALADERTDLAEDFLRYLDEQLS